MNDEKPSRWLNSRAYRKAREKVAELLNSSNGLLDLVATAQARLSGGVAAGKLSDLVHSSKATFRLLKAYASGDWRDISMESLMLIVASIIYFVMPLDALPDFILAFGYLDDAALLAWTYRSVADDLERFLLWESEQNKGKSITGELL